MDFKLSERKNPKFQIKGLSHVALVVSDMQRTVDFYQGVLGFPLIKTLQLAGDSGQHFFFDMGDGQSSLAFFWFPVLHKVAPGITVPKNNVGEFEENGEAVGFTSAVGSLNHIAFNVDGDKIHEYKARLQAAGIAVSPIIHHYHTDSGFGDKPDETLWLTSIYFKDPDGILLEFAAWSRMLTDADIEHRPATAQDHRPAKVQQRVLEETTA
jgi:catechol 2,3-dioxygenase-like lactoylglutathione lyase family enzyme